MKSLLLILFFILIPLLIFSQVYQIDSVVLRHCRINPNQHYKSVDSIDVNGLLINSTKYLNDTILVPELQWLYTYAPSHKLLHLIINNYQNSIWVPTLEKSWQYDIRDSLLSYTYLNYNSGLISYGNRDLYSYDTLNDIEEVIHQQYIDSTSSWINNSKTTIYFDSYGKKFHINYETWKPPGIFSSSLRIWYFYLSNDSIDFYTEFQSDTGDSTIYQNVYDSLGYLTQTLENEWAAGSWSIIKNMTNYYYDSNYNFTGSGSSWWFGFFGWQPCDTAINSYDITNQLISYYNGSLGNCGRGGHSGWYAYNLAGYLDSSNQCSWTMGTIYCSTCTFEYISLRTGISSVIDETCFGIFPNPVINEITIFVRNYIKPMTIVFYDIMGRTIKTEKVSNEKSSIIISDLSSGIYFVTLKGIQSLPIRMIKL